MTAGATPEAPLVIEHREALVWLLAEGSELEHGIMCEYLFAAFSLKQGLEEGLTQEQLTVVDGWRRELFAIAGQEMLHFALVTNVLTALGYAPHVGRPNLPTLIRHYPAAVQLALVPFGEEALEHFQFLERPEGMDQPDAAGFVPGPESAPLMGPDDIVPGRQDFATIGHLYRSLEAGLARLCEKYGEERVFVGPARAQATPETFHWPQLVAVTDLASAQAAIEVIVEQGEGARGDWEHSHYGRFVAMTEEYRRLKATDPGFEPARPCIPTFVRPPADVDALVLCTEPGTAAVADIFNVGYEVMLQLLARYFGHGHETPAQAQLLADVAVQLMRTVIKPVGQLLTKLPAGPDRPGVNAGPAFELFYSSDYMLPHHEAAWRLFVERLGDLAAFADRLLRNPAAPPEIADVRDAVLRISAMLAEQVPGAQQPPSAPAAGQAPQRPVLAPRPHLRPVTSREELLSLLSAAAAAEHALACAALFAAYTVKNDVGEGVVTEDQAGLARGWKRDLTAAATDRMMRLGQLGNLVTAVGGTLRLHPLADDARSAEGAAGAWPGREPFSAATIDRLASWEVPDEVVLPPGVHRTTACASLGDIYYRIETAAVGMVSDELFIGPATAQAGADFLDLDGRLVPVVDRDSAVAAVRVLAAGGATEWDTIRRQHADAVADAERTGATFAPARTVMASPPTIRDDERAGGSTLIVDEPTRAATVLFDGAHDLLLSLLGRRFDTDLDRVAARLLNCVLRPLGDALTQLPADSASRPGLGAGPGFAGGAGMPLPAHQAAAAAVVGERLWRLATAATTLRLHTGLPSGLVEATAALQDLACRFAPGTGPGSAAARVAELAGMQAELGSAIQASSNGPYLVTNPGGVTDWLGRPLPIRPQLALCRCGASAIMPSCDGACARIGFTDGKDPKRVPDHRDTHIGADVTVLDNRGSCAHAGFCTDRLATVFHAGQEPFVDPNGAAAEDIVRAVRACPSGALSHALAGTERRDVVDQDRAPLIQVSKDGPYRITGGIPLLDRCGNAQPRNEGMSLEHYSLCRCGHSQNKPFCSGMHWYVNFHDPLPDPNRPPTLFEWAGGLPALTAMTRLFYDKYVPADPLLAPLFAQMAPDHPERVAAWLGEVFGGPSNYSDDYGGYSRMLSQHVGRGLTETQRARWASLICRSAEEVGLPADAEFRSAFVAYIEWGSRLAVENSQQDAHPPQHMPCPHWGWGEAGPPGGRASALAPPPEEMVVTLPPADEPISFAQHIKPLFRASDRQSMTFVFDLWSHQDVSAHAEDILRRLRDGSMPCDGAWPAERVDAFARWTASGRSE